MGMYKSTYLLGWLITAYIRMFLVLEYLDQGSHCLRVHAATFQQAFCFGLEFLLPRLLLLAALAVFYVWFHSRQPSVFLRILV